MFMPQCTAKGSDYMRVDVLAVNRMVTFRSIEKEFFAKLLFRNAKNLEIRTFRRQILLTNQPL